MAPDNMLLRMGTHTGYNNNILIAGGDQKLGLAENVNEPAPLVDNNTGEEGIVKPQPSPSTPVSRSNSLPEIELTPTIPAQEVADNKKHDDEKKIHRGSDQVDDSGQNLKIASTMSRSTTQPKKKGIVLVLEDTPIPAKHLNALQSSIEEMQFDVDVFENETFDKGITLIVQEVLQSRNTNPFLFYIRCHDDFVDQLNAILSSKTSVHYHQHVIIFIDCISKHESRGRTTVALPPDTLLFLSSTAAGWPPNWVIKDEGGGVLGITFNVQYDEDLLAGLEIRLTRQWRVKILTVK
ncbi:hypothetical protein CAPTEDRAFT_190057 [Capitella teleta]|uniref:Uncharacterized protein n=1 Tax=Capitella teleta TaxID=283909 RepID=R7VLI7_CAPTE|nr:hypothetical protein CAPTEDRAFT_190057 [Capitella teleta]|eukprot:ELU18306.1 hypothetical protein CAPTEDRAFT_190057 [Capitella teleta]